MAPVLTKSKPIHMVAKSPVTKHDQKNQSTKDRWQLSSSLIKVIVPSLSEYLIASTGSKKCDKRVSKIQEANELQRPVSSHCQCFGRQGL